MESIQTKGHQSNDVPYQFLCKKKLNDKSPILLFKTLYGEVVLNLLDITCIESYFEGIICIIGAKLIKI